MKSENGQSLVEFALVLPVLIMLLFGIVDFGRAFHAYLTIDHAGREAARAASIGKNDSEIKQIAKNQGVDISLKEEWVSVSTTTSGSEKIATITITYPFQFITPVLGPLVKTIELKDETQMRIE
ncbi:TadE/TadG family type IV pilus assembly protein [Neobacillus dielmonensis]|uniref:TadE/TadG family type IV pilus assembly protein n=1 Tax=Neobacillus dielmonensis TaxID=1347369 RepID=UPI000693F4C2|nr:TadE/TadG family type IV pilus assembly protein [Neobacillus dielmonensis]